MIRIEQPTKNVRIDNRLKGQLEEANKMIASIRAIHKDAELSIIDRTDTYGSETDGITVSVYYGFFNDRICDNGRMAGYDVCYCYGNGRYWGDKTIIDIIKMYRFIKN